MSDMHRSYEDQRADARGGAMEKILAKYAGDDSEEREAERRRQARIKVANYALASKKAVLKEMLFENYEEHLIDRRLHLGVVADMGWSRMQRQRNQNHMNGELPDQKKLQVDRYTPKKNWPGKHQLSREEQELAKAEGDTGGNLKDGNALALASSKVTTTLPIFNEGLRLHRVVQVSTGFGHTLIRTAVGVALSYGNGKEGQLGHGDRNSQAGAKVIMHFRGLPIVGVAAGLHHSCCIAESGLGTRIFTFGRNDRGQLGVKKTAKELPRSEIPVLIQESYEGLKTMAPVQVSAGNYHTGVVTDAGALYCWGDNKHGQLGIGSSPSLTVSAIQPAERPGAPRRVIGSLGSGARQVDHVAMGAFHTAAVTFAGSVFTCGKAKGGRLGHPNQLDDLYSLRCIESLAATSRIVNVDAGAAHTLCCDDEGVVYSFGMNNKFQLGLLGTPAIVTGMEENAIGVEGGGQMQSSEWADNRCEESFVSRHSLQSRGRRLAGTLQSRDLNRERSSASRRSNRLASRDSSRTRSSSSSSNAWSDFRDSTANDRGSSRMSRRTGRSVNVPRETVPPKNSAVPRRIVHLDGIDIRRVAAGGKHSLFVTGDGRLYSCGKAGANARLGHINDEDQSTPKLVEYFVKKTITDMDKWTIQFRAIFSLAVAPLVEHDRRPALPQEAATFQGKIMNGNKINEDSYEDARTLLSDCKYANLRRQAINLFRHYDKKDRGYVGPLEIERIFPRLGIFMFDFQVDRLCKKYHKRGGPGSSNNITEENFLEYLADERKDLQSGILHAAWKSAFAPKPPPQLKDGALPEFLKIFERKCELAGESAPHKAIHLLSKPLAAPGKKKPPKKDRRRYRKIERGKIDLRGCALTDNQFSAFLFAQKCVPIFSHIDARQNLISDASIDALTSMLNWQLDVDELNPEMLYCYNCHELVEFNRRTVETCFCLHCGTTLHRPRYVTWNLKIHESKHPPRSELKWAELDFDSDCLIMIAERFENRERTSPEKFEDLIWELADEHINRFADTIIIPLGGNATKKGRLAIEEKKLLLEHFHRWVERRIEQRYKDMYHRQAVFELFEHCKSLCMQLVTKVNGRAQEIIPTCTAEILAVTQKAHEDIKDDMANFDWCIPKAMLVVYEILFLAARNVFRHYVASNLDCRPDTISCGERYSTISMESGRVVTIGNQDNLVESFKEEILGNLPSRFRNMAAKERVKRAKEYALAQQAAAIELNKQIEEAESEILSSRTSVSQSTRMTYTSNDISRGKFLSSEVDNLSNEDSSIQLNAAHSRYAFVSEGQRIVGADKKPNVHDNADVEQSSKSPVNEVKEEDEDEDECEENEDGPASPVRLSPVRYSPLRRAKIPVQQQFESSKLVLGSLSAQVPSYVELTADEWNLSGEARSSDEVQHARDVLDDPDEFKTLFKELHLIFEEGYILEHVDERDYTETEVESTNENLPSEAPLLYGTEKYIRSDEEELKKAREREMYLAKTKASNQELSSDEELSDIDSLSFEHEERMKRLEGLNEFDGERRMDEDPVYVFSGGRLSIRKMRIGSTDQTREDTLPLTTLPRRTFFLEQRPRLRTRDIFGRRL